MSLLHVLRVLYACWCVFDTGGDARRLTRSPSSKLTMIAKAGLSRILVTVGRQSETATEISEFSLTPNLCACNGSDSLGSDSEEVCVIRHVDITFLHSRDIAEKSKVVNPLDKVNIHETLDYWWSSQRWRRSEEVFQGRILPNITHVGTERNGAQAESIHCCKMWRSIKLNKWSKLWELAQSTMSKIFFLIWISSLFKFRCKWVNFEIIHFLVHHAYALLQYHCLEYYYYWLLITAAAAGQEVEETWREIGREFQIKKNSVTQKKRVRVLVSLNY